MCCTWRNKRILDYLTISNKLCPHCKKIVETAQHFLLECPEYEKQRSELFVKLQTLRFVTCDLTLNDLLGDFPTLSKTKKVSTVKFLQKFCITSG